MFPGFVLPADVTDRGWWFHDWEGDRAMLQLAHRNAVSSVDDVTVCLRSQCLFDCFRILGSDLQ